MLYKLACLTLAANYNYGNAITMTPQLSSHIVPSSTANKAEQAVLFNTCRTSTVLRALLLVIAYILTVSLFAVRGHSEIDTWIIYAGTALACAVPATLLWLMLSCILKNKIKKYNSTKQWWWGVLLGALCGAFAASLLASVRDIQYTQWLACILSGSLLAAQMVSILMLRTQLQAPTNVQAQLAELQARIRPHFLFNSLNSAIALISTNPQRAELMLENLGDIFRHMLQDVRTSSSLGTELELAQRYLDVESVRFGKRLRVNWNIDSAANIASMPTLFLQPLLENAIKHGVEPSPEGADITVRTMLRGNIVCIIISNTTPANKGKKGNNMALANVRKRLELLYDIELRFSAKEHDGMFHVRIEVPMQIAEKN